MRKTIILLSMAILVSSCSIVEEVLIEKGMSFEKNKNRIQRFLENRTMKTENKKAIKNSHLDIIYFRKKEKQIAFIQDKNGRRSFLTNNILLNKWITAEKNGKAMICLIKIKGNRSFTFKNDKGTYICSQIKIIDNDNAIFSVPYQNDYSKWNFVEYKVKMYPGDYFNLIGERKKDRRRFEKFEKNLEGAIKNIPKDIGVLIKKGQKSSSKIE